MTGISKKNNPYDFEVKQMKAFGVRRVLYWYENYLVCVVAYRMDTVLSSGVRWWYAVRNCQTRAGKPKGHSLGR